MKQKNLLVILLLVVVFGCKKDQNGPDINKGLVSYFNFDDNLKDQMNYAENVVPHNNPTFAEGKIGKSIQLNGTNQYVEFSSSKGATTSEGSTISLWIKIDQFPNNASRKILYLEDKNQEFAHIHTFGTNIFNAFYSDQPNGFNGAIGSEIWTHLVLSSSKNESKLFINGLLESTENHASSFSSNYSNADFGYLAATDMYLGGNIDELRIYNRALSQEEVTLLYNLK